MSNKTLAYKVDDVRTVLPEDVSSLSIERDKDYVTLATYTPYGINDYRLLVRETRTKYVAEREKSTAKKTVVAGTWISDYAPLRVQDGCGAGPLPRTVLQYRDQDQVRKRRQSHTMICLKPTRNAMRTISVRMMERKHRGT